MIRMFNLGIGEGGLVVGGKDGIWFCLVVRELFVRDDKADRHHVLQDTCGDKGASIETKTPGIDKEERARFFLENGHRLKTAEGPGP